MTVLKYKEFVNENLNEAMLGHYVDLGDVLIASKNFRVTSSPWHDGKVKKGQRFKILNAASYGWELEDLQPDKETEEMMATAYKGGPAPITIEVPNKKVDAWLEPEEPSAPYRSEFDPT
jgi:hypothetical protein